MPGACFLGPSFSYAYKKIPNYKKWWQIWDIQYLPVLWFRFIYYNIVIKKKTKHFWSQTDLVRQNKTRNSRCIAFITLFHVSFIKGNDFKNMKFPMYHITIKQTLFYHLIRDCLFYSCYSWLELNIHLFRAKNLGEVCSIYVFEEPDWVKMEVGCLTTQCDLCSFKFWGIIPLDISKLIRLSINTQNIGILSEVLYWSKGSTVRIFLRSCSIYVLYMFSLNHNFKIFLMGYNWQAIDLIF